MEPTPPASEPVPRGVFRGIFDAIRAKIISGLLFMLPIVITLWIVYWIYTTLKSLVLDPTARLVKWLGGIETEGLPVWWQTYVSPIASGLLALLVLYVMGYFVSAKLSRALDWVFMRVPGVTTVYKAVSNVVQSLQGMGSGQSFKRVVLVQFPHPGSRALGVVTKIMHESATGETILCVCVLTGVMPPAGFTLFVLEKDAIELPWSMNDSLQIILSGGITAPALLPFYQGSPAGLILPETREKNDAVAEV